MKLENGPKAVVAYKPNGMNVFTVDWHICSRCNFDCSYCGDIYDDLTTLSGEFHHDLTSKFVSLEKMKMAIDSIRTLYGGRVSWSHTGGEPTIIPWFIDVAQYEFEAGPGSAHVSVTTNGSRTIKYFLKLFQYLNSITLSMHFEFMAHREEEYIDKIIKLENWRKYWNNHNPPENHKWLCVRFMAEPGQFDRIERMHKIFVDAGVEKIEIRNIRPLVVRSQEGRTFLEVASVTQKSKQDRKLWKAERDQKIQNSKQDQKLQNIIKVSDIQPLGYKKTADVVKEIREREEGWYSTEEKNKLDEMYDLDNEKECKKHLTIIYDDSSETYHNANQLNYEYKNNFEGWNCYTGISLVTITANGDLWVAGCHVGGKQGNIYKDPEGWLADQAVRKEPIMCPEWRCPDNLAIGTPKARPGYEHLVLPYVVSPMKKRVNE